MHRPTALSARHFILLLFAPIVSNPSNAYFLHLQVYVISNDDGLYFCLPINRAGLPSRHHDQIPQLHAACKQKCRKMVWGQQTKCRHISLLRLPYLPVALFSCARYRRFHTRQDYWFANRPADFSLFDPWDSPNLSLWLGHWCPTKHSKPLSTARAGFRQPENRMGSKAVFYTNGETVFAICRVV